MRSLQQVVQVTYAYSVYFTEHLFTLENPLFCDVLKDSNEYSPKRVLCVVDDGLLHYHPGLLEEITSYFSAHEDQIILSCSPLIMPGGEKAKNNLSYVNQVQEAIHQSGICRHSYVLAIGGGAFIDMVGYAAATAHRGVRLIRVPTTVLSQNDSGVGVKNSVNAFGKKNFLGTFAPPSVVINDSSFLTTLSQRDWRSGIAEAVKVALLKDAEFFAYIEAHAEQLTARSMEAMSWLIYRCAQLHLEHIATSGDPFESGSSRPLDFGHWAAHKLEQLSGYSLRHGEAVAIGIALDSTYAYLSGMLPESDWKRILHLFSVLDLRVYSNELDQHLRNPDHPECIFTGLQEFKEHLGGRLAIPLLKQIGQCTEVNAIDLDSMIKSIELLKRYQETGKDN